MDVPSDDGCLQWLCVCWPWEQKIINERNLGFAILSSRDFFAFPSGLFQLRKFHGRCALWSPAPGEPLTFIGCWGVVLNGYSFSATIVCLKVGQSDNGRIWPVKAVRVDCKHKHGTPVTHLQERSYHCWLFFFKKKRGVAGSTDKIVKYRSYLEVRCH